MTIKGKWGMELLNALIEVLKLINTIKIKIKIPAPKKANPSTSFTNNILDDSSLLIRTE